jgi:hypothetical protein
MSDAAAGDPFSTAKANLRDTIKWLATTLAALAAAVMAGVSISGISALTGWRLFFAVSGGGVGLICIFLAIGITLRLLTSEAYYFSELVKDNDLKQTLDAFDKDILSPNIQNIDALFRLRDEAIKGIIAHDKDAAEKYKQLTPEIARVTNLAAFLSLRRSLERSRLPLFGLALVTLLGLGLFAVCIGDKSDRLGALDQASVAQIDPGTNWSKIAGALSSACGDEPLRANLLAAKPFTDWVELRFLGPGRCEGVEISLPARLAAFAGSK